MNRAKQLFQLFAAAREATLTLDDIKARLGGVDEKQARSAIDAARSVRIISLGRGSKMWRLVGTAKSGR